MPSYPSHTPAQLPVSQSEYPRRSERGGCPSRIFPELFFRKKWVFLGRKLNFTTLPPPKLTSFFILFFTSRIFPGHIPFAVSPHLKTETFELFERASHFSVASTPSPAPKTTIHVYVISTIGLRKQLDRSASFDPGFLRSPEGTPCICDPYKRHHHLATGISLDVKQFAGNT